MGFKTIKMKFMVLSLISLLLTLFGRPLHAGNIGDFYLNMDGGHVNVSLGAYPEVTILPQGFAFNSTVYPNQVVIGNASLAFISGVFWASAPRGTIFRNQFTANAVYQQYMDGDAFVYPEHGDYDDVNHYVFNTPTLWISQGSSGSDQKFVLFIFDALNTFSSATKDKLKTSGLLMPTIQMLYRRSLVGSDADYLTWKSHPTVFSVAGTAERDNMRAMAETMPAGQIPPMVQLTVVDEGNWNGERGVDFFEGMGSEKFIETPTLSEASASIVTVS